MTNEHNYATVQSPSRPQLLVNETASFNGNPNDPDAPAIVKEAPQNTFYLCDADFSLWKKVNSAYDSWSQCNV